MMTYQEQMKHPKWQRKRLEVLEANNFKCQVCDEKEEELHVHHPFYRRGAMIWEYDKTELECLCHRCHKDAHAIDEKIKKALATCRDKESVLAFILGLTENPAPTPRRTIENPYQYDHYLTYDTHAPTLEEANKSAEAFFAKMRQMMGNSDECESESEY